MLAYRRRVSSLPFFVVLEVCTILARFDLGILTTFPVDSGLDVVIDFFSISVRDCKLFRWKSARRAEEPDFSRRLTMPSPDSIWSWFQFVRIGPVIRVDPSLRGGIAPQSLKYVEQFLCATSKFAAKEIVIMAGDGDSLHDDDGYADSRTPLLKASPSEHASSALQKLSSLLADWWLWEILSASLCLLALLVILIILLIYDSSALPDWPSVFTVQHSPSSSWIWILAEPFLDQFHNLVLCDYC